MGWEKLFTSLSSNGLTVEDGATNGDIKINGTEVNIYDDTSIRNALLGKADSNHKHILSDITDLDITNKTNGYALQYDSVSGKVKLSPLPSGTGSGATNMSGLSDVDVTTIPPTEGNVLTFSSGKWEPRTPTGGTLGGNYAIELSRWGVTNSITTDTGDVSLSTNNSNGLNNAMNWAIANGYSSMVLQPGTYLINEKIPLEPPSYFTLDLGGSTLRIRDNAEVRYGVVTFYRNQKHSRVTNGTIQGDRWTHDYYSWNSDETEFKIWTKWAPSKTYAIGDKIMPTNTVGQMYHCYWECTVAGTSGSTEPNFVDNVGVTTGTATFTTKSRHTHEWGHGVNFLNTAPAGGGCNSRHISVDNLELLDLTGDGVAVQGGYGWISVYGNVNPFSWEAGGINLSTGTLITDATRVRSSISIDLTRDIIKNHGYIGIAGAAYGGMGNDIVQTNPFDLVFYNSDGSFNSTTKNCEFFDEIEIPSGASTAKVVLHQSNVPMDDATQLRVIEMPKFIYIEACHMYNDRRCGASITGGKYIFIRNCEIHDISGTGPSAGIDIEDGYMYNQDIYIEKNFMYNCAVQLSFVGGKNINIIGNRVYGGANETWGGVVQSKMEGNLFQDGTFTIDGEMIFSNNYFHRGSLTFTNASGWMGTGSNGAVDNCVFYNAGLSINRTKPYCILISNTRFIADSDANLGPVGASFTAGIQPQTMVNCSFEGYNSSSSPIFSGDVSATEGWTYTNILFYNNKKPTSQASIKLPRGTYIGCRFNNPGVISYQNRPELIGCSFTWDGYALFQPSGTNDYLRFKECNFNGGSNALFYFNGYTSGIIEIKNSLFNYPNASSSNVVIFDGYWQSATNVTGGKIILDGNRFDSNQAIKIFNNPNMTEDVLSITLRNNTINSPVTFTIDSTHIKSNNYVNGTLDTPQYVTIVPTTGYYNQGTQLLNSNMATDGFMGWVCTVSGYMDAFSAWQANHSYTWGNYILQNGYVYFNTINGALSAPTVPILPTTPLYTTTKDINGIPTWSSKSYVVGDIVLPSTVGNYFYKCTTSGTSGAVEPTWGSNSTVVDGGVTWTRQNVAIWKLMGSTATFKKFGTLS